ncbi:MAG: beta-lactamase family protein [Xanthomonadales bacterium]|nr:beta-lactamase family protein [Xanthomonadales bacterium]
MRSMILMLCILAGNAWAEEAASPARQVANSFIEYWNAGDARAARDTEVFTEGFIERRGPDGLPRIMRMMYDDNGNITLHEIISSNDENVRYLASSEKGHWLNVDLDFTPDGRISNFGVNFTQPPAAESDRGLDAAQIAQRLEAHVDRLAAEGKFSGAVLLAKDSEPLFARAYGFADRDSKRPNALDTPINLGSMNKMFTGLAITQLVAQGKLDFDDTVGEHLPDYPNETLREQATLAHLLNHKSGLGSYWNQAYAENKDTLESLADFAALFQDQPLDFAPGEGDQYSNAGPVVLGLIIEKVTGQDYYDYIREHIYAPAGMVNSDHYDKFENLSGKATGYMMPEEGGELMSNQQDLGRIGSAAGGGYASANDLLRFAQALYDGSLIDEQHREIMTTYKVPFPDGGGYAYLYMDGRINGQRFVGHNGGAPGINAEFAHFPELGYTLVVLANQDRAASPIAGQARAWIGHSADAQR